MTEPTNNQKERPSSGLHIDIGSISTGGHTVIAGRDASLNVHAGGDMAQTTTITVGGVETTPQARDQMVQQIRSAEQVVQEAPLDPNTREAAEHSLSTLESQLTQERAPNPHILTQAAKQLYRLSPVLAGAVISIFSEPLVGQIVMGAGETALRFYEALMKARNDKK